MNQLERISEMINSDRLSFHEKIFILMTTMAEVVVALVFAADIILGENPVEIFALGLMLVVTPLISTLAVKKRKVNIVSVVISTAIVFILLPVTFFFGGGIDGGSIIWFSMAYLYLGLLLKGRTRTFFICLLTALAIAEYAVSYYYPGIVLPHSEVMSYLDSLVSVVFVGLIIFASVLFQNRLFERETEKARIEAEKVEEMSKAQSQFFSNMSHEIRTPINTIIGLNEMILREDVSDEVAEDAANIQAAGKMLLHLINDILDMSKIESGQMELTPVVYNAGDMLSEIVAMLWIRARDKGLEFHVNVSPDIPAELFGDEVRIKQILINVLNNAIKYTKEGSVTLSVQCGNRTGDDIDVVYSISDTGIGIKKESIPHLFSAFKRIDEEKNRFIEGTGLGLSIVKQLVDLMHGTISVNSVYTKGSTFVIEIPQRIISDENIGSLNVERHKSLNKHRDYKKRFEAREARVLVVDDNESNLLVVQKLLRDTGVQIDVARSGEEALKLSLDNAYHVIFMDHLMPEMDGVECHQRMRNQVGGKCRDAKIVALTANAGEDIRQMFRKEGFDGYIEKPVNGDLLEVELGRLLPQELVSYSSDQEKIAEQSMEWMQTHERKKPVMITTESVADVPDEFIEKYGIGILPHLVVTGEGTFRDGIEIETNGLLSYMENPDNKVWTKVYGVHEHELFFAKKLTAANNIVHIAISSGVENSGYPVAVEAANAFGNVKVIDSRHLSSGQGLMVLKACRMAQEGISAEEIAEAIKQDSAHVHTSFIVNDLEFLARAGQINERIANLTRAFMIRPVLKMKKGKLTIGGIYFGSKERAWKKYIEATMRNYPFMDKRIVFVTYVGLSSKDMELIRGWIEEIGRFEKIYFKKASPSIAVNCGVGTFGLLYRDFDT